MVFEHAQKFSSFYPPVPNWWKISDILVEKRRCGIVSVSDREREEGLEKEEITEKDRENALGKDEDKLILSGETLGKQGLGTGELMRRHNLSYHEVIDLIYQKKVIENGYVLIPSFIFGCRELGVLEVITKYLKEELGLSYHQIAIYLNRDERTIWTTYSKAKQKKRGKIDTGKEKFLVPSSIFKDKAFGPLEVLTRYLKEELELSYHEIAALLNRNDRTIWTTYNRAKKKEGNNG
jgi:DNA-binding CsgD family transcriptional regulator